jgi:hypothetical protein
MKIILICATGRSGSTTLQRIINTIPNSNISGEKYEAIYNLLNCYENMKFLNNMTPKNSNNNFLTSDELNKVRTKPSWYNCYDFEEVKNNIKNTIISILIKNDNKNEIRVLGFKEIRWFNRTHLLNDFLELFPNTKIICHLHDNLEKQLKSGWWDESSRAHILKYNEELINYASNNKNCYLSYMKNLFNIDELKNMFIFLDEPFDEEKYNFIIENSFE